MLRPGTTLMLSLLVAFAPAVPALAENILDKGLALYEAGQYAKAERYFRFVVTRDPGYWPAYLELGNTYMKLKEYGLARKQYLTCMELTKDPKAIQECRVAIGYIDRSPIKDSVASAAWMARGPQQYEGSREKLDDTSAIKRSERASASAASGGADDSEETEGSDDASGGEAGQGNSLKDRIIIVKPKLDHPPVRETTIRNVLNTLNILPPYIYDVLSRGGATINLAPNMVDKWTYLLKEKPDDETVHLEQDAARTYNKDVYIYERPIIKGTNELSSTPFDEEGIRNVLLHELGHAFDYCSGTFTAGDQFMKVHQQDVDAMDDEAKARLWYYVPLNKRGSAEAFAETFAGLLGATGKDTDQVASHFPRLRALVRDKLKL